MKKPITYKDAGVDIEKAEASLKRLKERITATHTPEVLSGVGLFGGFYEFPHKEYDQPVLVSSTDGVGTKLKIAFMTGRHDTVGQDIVNHCIDDIAVCGAIPLYFLDYFASGKLEPGVFESVVEGMTIACKEAGIPLIGGETAEMPDFYREGEYDISGTIVGVVEKTRMIDGRNIHRGDVLVGVSSNGLHTNGFTLARRVLLEKFRLEDHIDELGCTLGEELLKIHPNYQPVIARALAQFDIHGMAHVTGGGIVKNAQRILPPGLDIKVDWNRWQIPHIFKLIQQLGNVPDADMRQTFNMGVGLVFVLSETDAEKLLRLDRIEKFKFFRIGKVV